MSEERETLSQRLAYLLYEAASGIATKLPESAGWPLFRSAGQVGHLLLTGKRATVAANLSQVLGTPADSEAVRATVKESFDLYARYWYDMFRIPVMRDAEFLKRCEFLGSEHFTEAFEEGHGCIVALPHMGNYDAAGHWVAINGFPIVTVAEALRPRSLMELFLEHRERLGMRVLSLTAEGQVGTRLAEHLSGRWVAALVADRDLGGGGVEVEMFGEKRRIPAGPALLSLRTGAPILVATSTTTDDGWRVVISSGLEFEPTGDMKKDVVALTRLMAAAFERAIASKPADWHMFQPAWD